MTIKSLLIGSAAAIVAASGAQAADAIVSMDPEPVEYVEVCSAAGAGYFYIPGSEICLQLDGYVRVAYTYTDTAGTTADVTDISSSAEVLLNTYNDTEIGVIKSTIRMNTTLDNGDNDWAVDRAHISVGDLNVGFNGSIYDFDPVGEQIFNAGGSEGNQIQYSTSFDSVSIALQAVEATDGTSVAGDVAAKIGFSAGDLSIDAALGYDGAGTTSGNRLGAKVVLGYMGFGAHYQWSDGANSGSFGTGYSNVYGVSYSFSATDALTIALAADFADGFGGNSAADAFGFSAYASYAITTGLSADFRVVYTDYNTTHATADTTAFRARLTRSF